MRTSRPILLALLALTALGGCSGVKDIFRDDSKKPLEGERISVLELQESLEPDDARLEEQGLVAPAPWKNGFWPQAGGYPNHSMQNLDLSGGELKKLWSASIGKGTTDELPLTAQPVVVDGRIFTLDTNQELAAFDINNGKRLWRTDITAKDEDDHVIGGGVAYAAGVLYVTNGYNEVLALSPADGKVIWRKNIDAPSRAAPTIIDDRLYVTTLENRLLALNAADGSLLWDYTGISESAGLVGAASPAADSDIVVPAFSSGEIAALRVENGSVAWSDNLASLKRIGGLSGLSDIKALPVIDKGLVVAVSFSGKIAAIDERSGARVWQREIGSANTPWMAGNHLFVLSTENELVALGRDSGAIRWVTKLARFDGDDPIIFTGPVLAGGRLILAGTGGRVVEVDPETGKVIRQWSVNKTVSIPPIVAGGVLYLLASDGTLTAYK